MSEKDDKQERTGKGEQGTRKDDQNVKPRSPSPVPCAQCDEYLAGWKRALADYDNLKKDLARERTYMRAHALERATHGFLPVLDHFDAAVKFQPKADPPLADVPGGLDQKTKQWLSGVLHVRKELEDALKELGLQPFGEVGDAFDPNLHEAASERHEHEEGKPDHVILEVVSRGWRIGDRIIRPAKVIINNANKKQQSS
jgi:molecular chaperone GrpE